MFGFGARRLRILAPLSGRIVSLDDVPDPVFSARLVGDGVAIDPDGDGLVVAPCDGELVVLFSTGHAFGIRSPEGVEILVHIGIETVSLQGEGFTCLASQGDLLKAGDPVVRFEREVLARAVSRLSPVVVTAGARSFEAVDGSVRAGRDLLFTVTRS